MIKNYKNDITYTPFDRLVNGLSYGGHIKGWIKSENKQTFEK